MTREVLDEELRRQIVKGEEIRDVAAQATTQDDLAAVRADYYTWGEYNSTLLRQRFTTTALADEYSYWGIAAIGGPRSTAQQLVELTRDIETKLRRLASIRKRLPLFVEPEAPREAARQTDRTVDRNTIFIVHGRDDARKLAVHGFLRDVTTLKAIILHDQPNAGRTIIEKFEDHAGSAAFAVIILTGDDEGGLRGKVPKPRARQNVIFEFGFFVGAIGRNRVAILHEPGVERPSDVDGVTYIALDDAGGWKVPLARELKAAGVPIDPDKLL